jgi:phosphatidylserine/phosphatidylglycerophosphate/cardiolipin synthase-like enzyme
MEIAVAQLSDAQLDSKIQSNLTKFKKPGVPSVRPDYEISGQLLTGKRAFVATVRAKTPLSDLTPGEARPDSVNGVPVDVRQASPYQRLRIDLTANIRTQPDTHNKGFVIDQQTVIVSSQNFSPAGVSNNRDPGVILESPELAVYFEPVFVADWDRALRFVRAPAPRLAGKHRTGGRLRRRKWPQGVLRRAADRRKNTGARSSRQRPHPKPEGLSRGCQRSA